MPQEGHPAPVSTSAYQEAVRIIQDKGYILGPQVAALFANPTTSYNLRFDVETGRFKERTGRDVEIHYRGMNVVIFANIEQEERDAILQRAQAKINQIKVEQAARRRLQNKP